MTSLCLDSSVLQRQVLMISFVSTAGLSGVLPAQACARYLQVPMIFAREKKPITMDSGAFEVGGCRLVMASLLATEV